MDLFNLVAKLTLDSSEYDRGLVAARATANTSGTSIASDMERTKKRFTMAAMAMGAAIAAFGVSSVKTKAEFDTAMSQVEATMGSNANKVVEYNGKQMKSIDALNEYAKEMGRTTRYSAIESAEALNYMALAGYDAEKSMKMLPNVMNLASAGAFDLATASDMVTDAESALGLTTEDTTKLVDEMARTSATCNASVSQLGEAILQVGGTARGLKGGTAELNQVLGILADNSIKGAEGGTALRNILLGIQSKKFEKTFGAMGVSAYDAEGNLRSLEDVFGDLNEVMDGMSQQERDKLISQTFNRQDLRAVNALLGTTAERWGEVDDAIASASEGGVLYRGHLYTMEEALEKYGDAIYDTEKGYQVLGAAEFMAMTQMDNLEGDVTYLKSAFEGLKISIGEKLEPTFRSLIQFLTKCIDNADTLGPIILGLASAFMTFGMGVGLKSAIEGLQKLWLVIAANPILALVALIAGLIVWLVTLYKNNEDFRNKVNAIWASIKNTVVSVVTTMVSTVTGIFNRLKNLAMTVFNAVKTYIINPLTTAKNNAIATFEALRKGISDKIEAAKNKVKSTIDAIKNMFPFNIGKLFSGYIEKPSLSINKKADGGATSSMTTSRQYFAKAVNTPYLFSKPTIFDEKIAGEAADELLYGRKNLMDDIKEATGDAGKTVNFNNTFYISGAENPEDWGTRLVHRMELDMRTI